MGWSRDAKGRLRDRHIVKICNTLTSMCGGGRTGEDGLGNTTPYVIEVYEGNIR